MGPEQPIVVDSTGTPSNDPSNRKNTKEIIAPVQEVAQINKKLPKGYSYVLVGDSSAVPTTTPTTVASHDLPSRRERKKTNYAEIEPQPQEPGKEKRPRGRPRKNSLSSAPAESGPYEELPPTEDVPMGTETLGTEVEPTIVTNETEEQVQPTIVNPTVEIPAPAPVVSLSPATTKTSVTVSLGGGVVAKPQQAKTPGRKKGSKFGKKRGDSDGEVSDDDEFGYDDFPTPKRSKPSVKTRLSDTKPGRRKSVVENEGQALAQCRKILVAIKKHQWAPPFLVPVDPELLGIPDYFTIIKHPMDLGTVLNNLDKGYYTSHDEFADDMRLIWQNAMTYNAPESEVYKMAQTLSKLFEEKYKKLENSVVAPKVTYTPPPKQTISPKVHQTVVAAPVVSTPLKAAPPTVVASTTGGPLVVEEKPPVRMYGDISSEELATYVPPQPTHTTRAAFESKAAQEMEKMVKEMRDSLRVVREEIQKLRKDNQKAVVAAVAAAPPPPPPPVVTPHRGPGRPPGKSLAQRDMTYEEKQQLTQSVKLLNEENLQTVIQIIQASMPQVSSGQEELEVDLDSLDTATLRRLEKFIKGVVKSESKKKRPKAPAPVAVETPQRPVQAPTAVAQPAKPSPVAPALPKPMKEDGSSSDSDSSSSSSSSSSDSESSADEKPKPMETQPTTTAPIVPSSVAPSTSAPVAEPKDSEPQVLKPETKEVEIKNLDSWSNFDVPEAPQQGGETGKQDNSWMQYQNMNQQKKQKEKERQEIEERERKEKAEREAERRKAEELRQKQIQEEEEKKRQIEKLERERAEKALQEQREKERQQRELEAQQQQRRFQEESDINSTLAELEQASRGVNVLDLMMNPQSK